MDETRENRTGAVSMQSKLDHRWLMSYMACLTDNGPDYYDTGENYPAHPLFPVCVEWPVILKLRGEDSLPGDPNEVSSIVHASHDLHIHKPLLAGQVLTTSASITGTVQKKPGVYETICMQTRDENGVLVCTTYQGSMRLGEVLSGPDTIDESSVPVPQLKVLSEPREYEQYISSGFAHVYTECARIWNPIHTDRRLARNAGLPDILLHGTATLALAVSRIVEHELDGNYACVNRIAGRFSGMVFMPSKTIVRVVGRDKTGIAFEVLKASGPNSEDKLISGGYIGYHC